MILSAEAALCYHSMPLSDFGESKESYLVRVKESVRRESASRRDRNALSAFLAADRDVLARNGREHFFDRYRR